MKNDENMTKEANSMTAPELYIVSVLIGKSAERRAVHWRS
jgi:hypothetical protein